MIKAIISDLDGTLLNPEHLISDFTKETLQELHQKGYQIVVATGRHHKDALPIIKAIGLPLHLVSSNGARVHLPGEDLAFSYNIPNNIAKAILQADYPDNIYVNLYADEHWYVNKANKKMLEFHAISNFNYEVTDFKKHDIQDVVKIFFTASDHEALCQVADQIEAQYGDQVHMTFSLPECLEVMAKNIDKSFAIKQILENLNITPEETVAFGDGFNDKMMLEFVGQGFVMDNATDKLKAELQHLPTVGSNAEHGVAVQLKQMLL